MYDRPLIFYPLSTLLKSGIREILIITTPEHQELFRKTVGEHPVAGANISYAVQPEPRGLAEAFIIGADFIGDDYVTLILGDNIFENDFREPISNFQGGGLIFAKEVPDPQRYGVIEFDNEGQVLSIEEKPENPKSSFCIPGIYIFDNQVVEVARTVEPSLRGELEIVDIHNTYLQWDQLRAQKITGNWLDAGTFESFYEAQTIARNKLSRKLVL